MQTKKISYLLLISLFMILQGRAQAPNYTLMSNESGSNKSYVARDYVSLQPEFSYRAVPGQVFNAKIDAGLLFPPTENTYALPNGQITTDPTQGAVVGAIHGRFAVSPTGAATYSIPIEVPAGINGMQPNISLVYNSQGGFGAAGLGWNIAGSSSIARGAKNIYFDGVSEFVKLDNTDALYLNGQRLIYISGGNGNLTSGAVYATEEEDYSRIVFDGSCFVLKTLDGKVLEYGVTNDSKLRNSNNPNDAIILSWKLNKVIDSYGNYMTFTYIQNGQYLHKINYTFNQNSNSGQEIEFEYQTNNFNPQDNYIKTFKRTNNKLLKNIYIKSNSSLFKTYTLNNNNESRLESIREVFSDGSKVGDVEIQWDSENETTISKIIMNSANSASKSWGGSMFMGDLNGDGYSDWIQLLAGDTGKLIVYLFDKATNSFVYKTAYSFYYSNGQIVVPRVVVSDFDLDGKDEIVVYNCMDNDKTIRVFKLNETAQTYTFSPYTLTSYISLISEHEVLDATSVFKITEADANGDQYPDLILAMSDGVFIYYGGESLFDLGNVKKIKFTDSGKFYFGDFDGDKKNDILGETVNGNNQTLGDNEISYVRSNLWDGVLQNKRRIFSVDVNQDNLCDIIFQNNSQGNYTWGVAYNTGGFNMAPEVVDYPIFHAAIPSKPNEDDYETPLAYLTRRHDIATPIDYNGDGLVDFVVANETHNTYIPETGGYGYSYTTWYFYKNLNGKTFELEKQLTDNTNLTNAFVIKDINGDGISDFSFLQGGDFKAYSKSIFNVVTQIKNSNNLGLGYSISYKNLSDFESYNLNEASSVVRPFRKPLIVVDSYVNPQDAFNCSYEIPKVHTKGKGFLGFGSISEWCAEFGRLKVTTKYDVNDFYDTNLLSQTLSGANNAISTTTQENGSIPVGEKRYIPIVSKIVNSDITKGIEKSVFVNYSEYPNKITRTTNIGNVSNSIVTTYDYRIDATGEKSLIPYLPKVTISSNSNENGTISRTTNYEYNHNGDIEEITKDPGNKGQIITELRDFDKWGHPLSIKIKAKDADNIEQERVSTVTYTESGRFINSSTNVLGETTTYNWDENKDILKSETDAYSRQTIYTYNSLGQLTDTRYPNSIHKVNVLQWGKPSGYIGSDNTFYQFLQVSGQAPVITYYEPDGKKIQTDTYGLNNKKKSVSYFENYDIDANINRLYSTSDPYFDGDTQYNNNVYYDNFDRPLLIETPSGSTSISYNNLTTTVNSSTAGVTESILNSSDQIEYNTVNGETVHYSYYPSGLVHTCTPENGGTISMVYDLQGRKTKLIDPNLGTIRNEYNGFGELVLTKQKIHLNEDSITTIYKYSPIGVLKEINRNGEITSYSYDNRNRVEFIEISGQHKQTFIYDEFDRITTIKELVGTREFAFVQKHDALGRVKEVIYPSGYSVQNIYDSYSNLIEVKSGTLSIWKANSENSRGQLTSITLGSNKVVNYGFDSRGILESINANGIVNLEYYFNDKTNLEYRIDHLTNQREDFIYDDMNRLTDWEINRNGVKTPYHLTYNLKGNIINKSDLGNYTLNYNETTTNQNALTSITGLPDKFPQPTSAYPYANLIVNYTDFSKIKTLSEMGKNYTITYGIDDQRRKSVFTNNGQTLTKYYLGDYEEEHTGDGNIRKIHYLSGAIYVDNSIKADSLYYVFTDHQGSAIALTDGNWNLKRKFAYDPWGARRNPNNWTEKDNGNGLIISRGYTFHEHLDAFGIINMNGRVYDPLTAQFFSADPFINQPDNWLSYNRYAYCKGNPLNRIDPTGYADIDGGDKGDLYVYADYSYYGNDNSYNSSDSWGNFGDFGSDEHPTDNGGIIHIMGSNLLSQSYQTANLSSLSTPKVGVNVTPSAFSMPMTMAYLKGLINGLGSVGNMILHPVNTLNGMGNAILHPLNTYNTFNNIANDYVSAIRNGDGQKFANYTGNFLGMMVAGGATGGSIKGLSQAGKAAWVGRAVTTSDGFLFGSIGFKTPIDLKVGLYASENTIKYGTFQWSTIAPEVITKNQWFGRNMLQITPTFQETLGPWSSQVIPQGTYLRIGLVGPQTGVGFGTWLQLYAPQGINFIK